MLIAHYSFDTDSIEFVVNEYAENASNLYYMGENDEFKCIVGGQILGLTT